MTSEVFGFLNDPINKNFKKEDHKKCNELIETESKLSQNISKDF